MAPSDDEVFQAARYPVASVTAFVATILANLGLTPSAARSAADILLVADLRGVESHGVARLPYYADRLRKGRIATNAELTVVRESPATLALDANNGFGLSLAPEAMARCIAKAETAGVCLTTVRHANHFGIAGYYAMMAAGRGLGGMAMTNASPLVVPLFGARPMLGTNPIAVAVPTGPNPTDPPFVLDMSTSTVAWGKIEIARRANQAIPLGWGIDADGAPTTDPWAVTGLTPLGGDRTTSGHKGYGLGALVDILCGPLAGAAWGAHVLGAKERERPAGLGHTFMAWRIDAFRDADQFYADLNAMLTALRGTPPVPGHEATGVLIPGDPEAAATATNLRLGVPIAAAVIGELRALAIAEGIAFSLEVEQP